jgi:hypothetical protein
VIWQNYEGTKCIILEKYKEDNGEKHLNFTLFDENFKELSSKQY